MRRFTSRHRETGRRAWLPWFLASSLLVPAATAATIEVNSTAADSGAGSLRQAITDANADPGAATINIQAGLGKITLTSELPILKNPAGISINGNGNTVDGGSTSATTGSAVSRLSVNDIFHTLANAWRPSAPVAAD